MNLEKILVVGRNLKREFRIYLNDVLEAIGRVKKYSSTLSKEDLLNDTRSTDAILRNLEIIGEAVTQLPEFIQDKYRQVPWRDIQDFRIVVAHLYWQINIDRIWDIIENKLDPLKKQISMILRKEKM